MRSSRSNSWTFLFFYTSKVSIWSRMLFMLLWRMSLSSISHIKLSISRKYFRVPLVTLTVSQKSIWTLLMAVCTSSFVLTLTVSVSLSANISVVASFGYSTAVAGYSDTTGFSGSFGSSLMTSLTLAGVFYLSCAFLGRGLTSVVVLWCITFLP